MLLALVKNFEVLKGRRKAWKGTLESKGLGVNVKVTKMVISNENGGEAVTVILCYASFAVAGCIRDAVILNVN